MPMFEEIEDLARRKEGLTELEIAHDLRGPTAYQQTVNKQCRLLAEEGRVERRGHGGQRDPFRYYSGKTSR